MAYRVESKRCGLATGLLVLALAGATACSEFEIENKAPIAAAQVWVGGAVVDLSKPIPYMGAPVAVVLDASMSTDEDGQIVKYLWLKTDVSPAERFAGNGLVDGGTLPPFTGDPAAVMQPTVTLGEGTYQYSVWVTDDGNRTSDAATVTFTVETPSNYMPNAECIPLYPSTVEACDTCVCSPAANDGCYELFQTCYMNADAMFTTLCTAVVACAVANNCKGSACFTPCMAEITAAGTYMGGDLAAACGDATVPAPNPCAAASQLGTCTNPMPTSGTPGICAPSCN